MLEAGKFYEYEQHAKTQYYRKATRNPQEAYKILLKSMNDLLPFQAKTINSIISFVSLMIDFLDKQKEKIDMSLVKSSSLIPTCFNGV